MKQKLKKVFEAIATWYLTAVLLIIFFGGTFAAAAWVVKCIIKLFGGM